MILNAALLVMVCLLGWYLRQKWIEARAQEHKIRTAKVRPPAVTAPPPLKKVGPIDGPAYAEVATKNLFSADRNPTPVPDPPPPPPPPKPMPPLPTAHGVMLWDGIPPTVVLSLGKGPQKGYRAGDKIGEFTLVSVNNKEIVFEWEGKQVAKRLDEIMERNQVAQQETAAPAAPAAAPAQSAAANLAADSNLGSNPNGPGKDAGGNIHMCNPGDTSPPGTVVDGLEKKVNTTPFGVTCRWEPVSK